MKTVQQWLDELAKDIGHATDGRPVGIAAIQSDALAEGERRGRIAGLREVVEMIKLNQPYLTQRILGRIKTLTAEKGEMGE